MKKRALSLSVFLPVFMFGAVSNADWITHRGTTVHDSSNTRIELTPIVSPDDGSIPKQIEYNVGSHDFVGLKLASRLRHSALTVLGDRTPWLGQDPEHCEAGGVNTACYHTRFTEVHEPSPVSNLRLVLDTRDAQRISFASPTHFTVFGGSLVAELYQILREPGTKSTRTQINGAALSLVGFDGSPGDDSITCTPNSCVFDLGHPEI